MLSRAATCYVVHAIVPRYLTGLRKPKVPHVPPAARTLDQPAAVDGNQPLFNSPIKWVRGPVTHWDPRRTHESRAVPHEPPGGFPFLDLAAARALCLDPTYSSSSFCSVRDRCGGVVEKVPPKKKTKFLLTRNGTLRCDWGIWWRAMVVNDGG